MMDRAKESRAVKEALLLADIPARLMNIQVGHGRGTAWGWLHIRFDIYHAPGCYCVITPNMPRETCQPCKDLWQECRRTAYPIVRAASGRDNYGMENVNISPGFIE